jgi:hypothetical protein
MAIIIPSKNIYDKSHSIIKSNKINSVDVNVTRVSPKTTASEMVFSQNYDDDRLVHKAILNSKYKTANSGTSYNTFAVVWVMSTPSLGYNIEIYVPVTKRNAYVKEMQDGLRQDTNEPWIGVSITGELIKRSLKGRMSCGEYEEIVSEPSILTETITSTETVRYDIPTLSLERSFSTGGTLNSVTVTESVSPSDESTIKSIQFSKKNHPTTGEECFYAMISFYTGVYKRWLEGSTQFALGVDATHTVSMSGEGEEYKPQSVEVTAYGTTVGIEVTDENI